MNQKNNTKPDAFIVVKEDGDFDIVKASVLDEYEYSTKAEIDSQGSKQIQKEGFNYTNGIIVPRYRPDQLIELLDMNTYHEGCVEVVANDSAGYGYTFVPTELENETELNNTDLLNFFNNCKPSINKLLYLRNYDRRAIGYGALELIREDKSDSKPKRLVHIRAHTLRRHTDGVRVKQQVGTKTVWFVIYGKNKDENDNYYDVHADTGEIHPYNSLNAEERANELLWTMDYDPASSYYGRPKIVSALPAILGDLSRAKYNRSFFKNYGVPAFAVTISGDFQDYNEQPFNEDGSVNTDYDETKTLKYKISKQLKEVMKNPYSAVCITVPSEGEEGNVEIKLQPLSVETKEASFRLFRTDNRDEVLHTHKVPPYRLGINETGNLGGSNAGESSNIYLTSTILPLKSDDEADINQLIFNEFGVTDWVFQINNIDQRNDIKDMDLITKLFDMASITPRQIIRYMGDRFGLKDDADNPYLDEYFVHGQPLSKIFETGNLGEDGVLLDGLENDLLSDAEVVDDGNSSNEETNINRDGIEDKISQKGNTTIGDRIKTVFSQRK